MCGIVGEWRQDGRPVDADRLSRARDALISRGPDDAGLHVDGPIGLGHRRLSIIDLSPAGRMPMSNETGEIWAVFNGEIYNFVALRAELVAHGHQFRSHTDSEVVVHAYEQWGAACFARFDGMFALAIWDGPARRLVLARDIAGEKPLYYAATPGAQVQFASTLSALLEFPEIGRDVDPEALRLYAELGYVPAPRAMIRGVRKVLPGTFVVLAPGCAPVEHTYWSLDAISVAPRTAERESLAAAAGRLHDVLRAAVERMLVADVPLGAFLSGGIDSSLVVALMAAARRGGVRTFTIGFDDPAFDESAHARRIAAHLGVENTVMVLSAADVLRELPALTRALDEPMADYSALPSLAVARLARQHVTVALTGDGADEAFGGYRYYAGVRLFEHLARLPRSLRAQVARQAHRIRSPRLARAVARIGTPDAASFFGRSGFYRGATLATGLAQLLPPTPDRPPPDEVIADALRAHPGLRPTEAGMLWDATHTLPDAWLTKVDRTTMAVGLETRAPFLDRRVLELAFTQPLAHRVRGPRNKPLLRALLARYVPRALFERPKQGFTAPMRTWFASELRDELHDRLAPARIERWGVFDPAGVQRLLEQQRTGVDHTQLLWALFHLDRWRETHLDAHV